MGKIAYPRHGDGSVNAGEKRLLDYLALYLPDDYYIIPNGEYANVSPQGAVRFWEYDAIVVAPHAIFHIENKDWGGKLEGDDFAWYINGAERKNPHKSATLKSKILASILQKKDPSFRKAVVQTVLTLSYPSQSKYYLDPQSACYQATFLLDHELINYITDAARSNKREDEIVDIAPKIRDFLTGQSAHQKHRNKTEVLDYKIDEVLQSAEEFTEYLCHPRFFASKKVKVREYPLDIAGKNKQELEKIKLKAENAKHAQERLDASPFIVRCECHLSDDQSYFYEISDYMQESTLRATLRSKTYTEVQKLQIILDVANALKEAHEKEVVHRDVNPENIYILNSGHAALANFGRSWYVEHINYQYSVKSELMDEGMSPYIAPDDNPSAESDIFSLGVVIYELLTNKQPFDSTAAFRFMGSLSDDKMPSQIVKDLPKWMDDIIRHTIQLDPNNRWHKVTELIDFIEEHLKESSNKAEGKSDGSEVLITSNNKEINLKDLKPGDQVTPSIVLYEELGKGGFGRVFKAKHTIHNKFYAIKIFDRDASVDETYNEYEALKDLHHPNIVKFIYNDKTFHGLFYTLMDLIEGENLNLYTRGDLKLPMREIYKMSLQILSALQFMQSKVPPVFHRDIKPNNIMWDKRDHYVLIDFNISTTTDDKTFAGTRPYMAPDLVISGKKIDWDCSADTFSLGVSIFELIAHCFPWAGSDPTPKVNVAPTDIRQYNDKISDEFANFIMKAITTDRNKRFKTAQEMIDALRKIGEDGLIKKSGEVFTVDSKGNYDINIVDYINSLYSQSQHGNGGTRANSREQSFDELTYTETKLDKQLKQDIANLKYKLVIVTGNAGDGKTAFIRQIEKLDPCRQAYKSGNGCEFDIQGVKFASNYDGSQDEGEYANDDVLEDFFTPFYGLTDYNEADQGRIIAINEGRLVDFLSQQPDLKPLADNIDDYFYNEGDTQLLPGLMIINLNLRSVTAKENNTPSLMAQQIKKLTDPTLWSKCQGCPIADRCFIKYNVDTFQDSGAGDEVINRLEWLLRIIVYKRELHITMRDLRSFLAFMLTRDYSCEQVKQLISYVQTEGIPELYWNFYYFNVTAPPVVVNVSLPTLSSSDRLVRLMRETDIAMVALPAYDRDLYYRQKQSDKYLVFSDRKRSLLEEFNSYPLVQPSWANDDKNKRKIISSVHRIFIRHQFFEGSFKFKQRLPYKYASDFNEALRQEDPAMIEETKQIIARAISISEGCDNKNLTDGYLLLSSSRSADPRSKSYRRFPLDEFELYVNKVDHLTQYVEFESDSFTFRHKENKFVQLTVSLDLFEMLKYIQNGFSPSINDLRGKFIELQIFKNLLESQTYSEILVTKNNKRFSVVRLTEGRKIIIEPLKLE